MEVGRPCVYMHATITFVTSQETAKLIQGHNNVCLEVGGFEFVCCDKSVQFDFDATSTAVEKVETLAGGKARVTMMYKSGMGPIFNETTTAEYYDAEWSKIGLTPADVTATFLAKATKVNEFYFSLCNDADEPYEVEDLEVKDVMLYDEQNGYPARFGTLCLKTIM